MSQKTRTMPGRSNRTDFERPDRVPPEVERACLRKREDIVVDAIAVRELDSRAGRDREHMGNERLVALVHHRPCRLVLFECAARGDLQVYDRHLRFGNRLQRGCAKVRDAGTPADGHRRATQVDAAGDRAVARGVHRPYPGRAAAARTRAARMASRNGSVFRMSEPVQELRREGVIWRTRPPSRELCWNVVRICTLRITE